MKSRKFKKPKKMINRENLFYRVNNYIYNFQQFETIRSFTKNNLLVPFLLAVSHISTVPLVLELSHPNTQVIGVFLSVADRDLYSKSFSDFDHIMNKDTHVALFCHFAL